MVVQKTCFICITDVDNFAARRMSIQTETLQHHFSRSRPRRDRLVLSTDGSLISSTFPARQYRESESGEHTKRQANKRAGKLFSRNLIAWSVDQVFESEQPLTGKSSGHRIYGIPGETEVGDSTGGTYESVHTVYIA